MADSSQKRWVVLLNKSPRGPFSAEEVKGLMNSSMASENDVAMEVTPDGKKPLSGWKFIWQIPEFAAFLGAKGSSTTHTQPTPPPPTEENTGEIEQELTPEELSDDLVDIAPEEMVLHTAPTVASAHGTAEKDDEKTIEATILNTPPDLSVNPQKSLLKISFFVMGGFLAFILIAKLAFPPVEPDKQVGNSIKKENFASPTARRTRPRMHRTNEGTADSGTPLSRMRPTTPVDRNSASTISERRNRRISQDMESEEDLDEARERTSPKFEEEGNELDEDEGWDEERTTRKKTKKKKKKSKKTRNVQEDEEYGEEGEYYEDEEPYDEDASEEDDYADEGEY